MIQRLINKLLAMEEMSGHDTCPIYLRRWRLLRTPWFAVYLHHFVGDDWSRDMHDHPKWFTSVGLWGSYVEETPDGESMFVAPWFRRFPPEYIHRIRLEPGQTAWTICIVGQATRSWGFWNAGRFIPWREYVWGPLAKEMRSCP